MPSNLFTRAATSDARDRDGLLMQPRSAWLCAVIEQDDVLKRIMGEKPIQGVRAWLARRHAAPLTDNITRWFRRARDFAGAGKKAKELSARAKALEAENEHLRIALQAYQRAAYLTLTQSNGVLDNRVRVDGKWHDLENRVPEYCMAIDELDTVYARVRQLIGERQFAPAPIGQEERYKAGAVKRRAGAADLRLVA